MKYLNMFENKEPEKIVKYHDNGNIKSVLYKINGNYHREDGPAYQSWYENGEKNVDFYYRNDKLHREDGPAYQVWNGNGEKFSEFYYLNDNQYNREKWLEKLKEMDSQYYKEQQMLYDMEKYNL